MNLGVKLWHFCYQSPRACDVAVSGQGEWGPPGGGGASLPCVCEHVWKLGVKVSCVSNLVLITVFSFPFWRAWIHLGCQQTGVSIWGKCFWLHILWPTFPAIGIILREPGVTFSITVFKSNNQTNRKALLWLKNQESTLPSIANFSR